jgi:hypothetical protein
MLLSWRFHIAPVIEVFDHHTGVGSTLWDAWLAFPESWALCSGSVNDIRLRSSEAPPKDVFDGLFAALESQAFKFLTRW